MGLLEYIDDQKALSKIQDWAKNIYGEDDPKTALAQADPRLFREMVPSLLKEEEDKNAYREYMGLPKMDKNGIYWNQAAPQQAPLDDQTQFDLSPEQSNAMAQSNAQMAQEQLSQNKKISALANLPQVFQQAFVLDQQGKQQQGAQGATDATPDVDRVSSAIANYKMAPPTGQQLRTPWGLAVQAKVLEQNPDYDANVFKERTKTKQDMSPGGVMGQKIGQAQTAINHLASWLESSNKLPSVQAGMASSPINKLINMWNSQNPNLVAAKRYQEMSGDEIAKFISGAGGSTENDREAQRELLSVDASPSARQAAAQSAIQTMFGKLEPIADQYNKAYGTNITPEDLLSPETKKSLSSMGMLSDKGEQQLQQGKGRRVNPALLLALKKRGLL